MKGKHIWFECAAVAGLAVAVLFQASVQTSAAGADTPLEEEYIRYCEEAGEAYNICPELLMAIIETESGGNPDTVGAAGETGLMQIYPKYHKDRMDRLEVCDLHDPRGNILVGTDYLLELFEKYRDTGTVLMVYNGTKNAEVRGEKGDYTDYAVKVMERSGELERMHGK